MKLEGVLTDQLLNRPADRLAWIVPALISVAQSARSYLLNNDYAKITRDIFAVETKCYNPTPEITNAAYAWSDGSANASTTLCLSCPRRTTLEGCPQKSWKLYGEMDLPSLVSFIGGLSFVDWGGGVPIRVPCVQVHRASPLKWICKGKKWPRYFETRASCSN